MNKLWRIKSYRENINEKTLIESLLKEKGIDDLAKREEFLKADLKGLSDPFIIPEMKKAVKRVERALVKNEKILIYGDYDVDGVTSTALLYHYFKDRYQKELEYFLPDRFKDGYGLNKAALRKIAEKDIDLIITVDCGITAFEEVKLAAELGMDVIITDHHTPSDRMPKAAAVLNHHLVDMVDYQAAQIAGVGTAYKLTEALEIYFNGKENKNFFEAEKTKNKNINKKEVQLEKNNLYPEKNLDSSEKFAAEISKNKNIELDTEISENTKNKLLALTALGTVADIAPLRNENRIFVKNGLKLFKDTNILGLDLLLKKLKLNKEQISAGQIGYIIAPPLNAAGRMYSAEKALRLLITDNKKEAENIADDLIKLNRQRQAEEEKIFEQSLEMLKKVDLDKERSIILYDQSWHTGIIGIVASRLVEKYNLPVILLAPGDKDGVLKASCRSISKLNIYDALKSCSNQLINFGGHKAAAGLSLKKDKLQDFKTSFQLYLKRNLSEEDYTGAEEVDLNFNLAQLNKNLVKQLEEFRPFGIGNPKPKFLFKDLDIKNCYRMGKDNSHLKFYLNSDISAVAFNMGDAATLIANNRIDVIAQPEINRWKGQDNLQLKILDFRISDDNLTPLLFKKDNFSFYDLRNNKDKKHILHRLLSDSFIKNAAVYINKVEDNKYFTEMYKDHHFFSRVENQNNEFDYLIFYSLPFSREHFLNILNNYTAAEGDKKIVLLFSEEEADFNHKLIKHSCPSQKMLGDFFNLLKRNRDVKNKKVDLADLQKRYFESNKFNYKTKRLFLEMLKIIEEVHDISIKDELIDCSFEPENELDFEASIRYNKLSRQMEKFIHFKEEIFSDNLFALIENVSNF